MALESQEIKKLSTELREATFGSDPLYGHWFRDNSKEYHRDGKSWSYEKLRKFFEDGLLSFYIGKELNLNLKNRSEQSAREKIIALNNLGIPLESARSFENKWLDCIEKLFSKIYDLELLAIIGAKFQRIKQLNEFLNYKIKDDCEIVTKIYENDQELENLQTIIYNWAINFVEECKNFLKDNQYDLSAILKNMDDFYPIQIPPFITTSFPEIYQKIVETGTSEFEQKRTLVSFLPVL